VTIPDSQLNTNFHADGSLQGYSGCNTYSTSYTVSGNSISIGSPSRGGKTCNEERTHLESTYLSALTSAASYALDGGQLFLNDASGTVIIEFMPR
jgi:heat shock protein HslJ